MLFKIFKMIISRIKEFEKALKENERQTDNDCIECIKLYDDEIIFYPVDWVEGRIYELNEVLGLLNKYLNDSSKETEESDEKTLLKDIILKIKELENIINVRNFEEDLFYDYLKKHFLFTNLLILEVQKIANERDLFSKVIFSLITNMYEQGIPKKDVKSKLKNIFNEKMLNKFL